MKLGMFNDSDESSEEDPMWAKKPVAKAKVAADILKDEDIFAKMTGNNDDKMTGLAQKELEKVDLWQIRSFKEAFETYKNGNGGLYGIVKSFDESLIDKTDKPRADSDGEIDCMQLDF
jgi:hypothetical protein